jgi:hypothetical protein
MEKQRLVRAGENNDCNLGELGLDYLLSILDARYSEHDSRAISYQS